MLESLHDHFWAMMDRGGVVMWPLLGLSVLAMTLALERSWFWLRTNHPARRARLMQVGRLLRTGDTEAVRVMVEGDASVYGRVVRTVLDRPMSEAAVTEAIESQRPVIERFMPTLSTIITAAPMLGILGTVLGIISSFQVLTDQATLNDPRLVGRGIAEALLTTAAGLVVAIAVLFPYNAFRAQVDRTLGRIESLLAVASSRPRGRGAQHDGADQRTAMIGPDNVSH